MFGAQVMTNYEKYLGFPMVRGRSRVSNFKELQEKGHKKGDGVEGKEHF